VNYLHVVVIEGYEECFVSNTEAGVHKQVLEWLTEHSLPAPTDEEWAVCILADEDKFIATDNPVLGSLSYYKATSRLAE
jgi:hypothetical protein